MSDFHVLIVGAGISGLLVAQALKKANIKYTIFESEASADTYRTRQWGLSIHWSTPLLQKILPEELWTRIHEAWVDPSYDNPDVEYLNIYDATTGEKRNSMKEPHHMRFNRARMRKFCAQGIEVQYNKQLASIERVSGARGVTAVFEDGSSASGSMIIGADGPNSKVRHLLMGDEAAATQPASTPENPFTIINAMIKYPKAKQAEFVRKLHPVFYMGLHPEGGLFMICIQDVADSTDPTTWTFQLFMNWRGIAPPNREDLLPALKSWVPKMVDPWKSAVEWIPDDTILETQRISFWHPVTRDNWDGRVTLVGDAAHPMVPYRGQGLSHCIADVTSLLTQLQAYLSGEKTLAQAVDVYDAEVVSRAGDEVKVSLQSMNFLMNWEMVEQSPSFRKSADPNEAALKVINGE